mmetsp:Transcript_24739/g.69211  ORF Transcript_24739/g.69211 Transcript_24739/m.69211 type:complete len:712 (+) Transcript_24739:1992-4127(+)
MEGGPNPPGHAAYLPAPARGEPPLRLLRPGAHRAHHRAQLAGVPRHPKGRRGRTLGEAVHPLCAHNLALYPGGQDRFRGLDGSARVLHPAGRGRGGARGPRPEARPAAQLPRLPAPHVAGGLACASAGQVLRAVHEQVRVQVRRSPPAGPRGRDRRQGGRGHRVREPQGDAALHRLVHVWRVPEDGEPARGGRSGHGQARGLVRRGLERGAGRLRRAERRDAEEARHGSPRRLDIRAGVLGDAEGRHHPEVGRVHRRGRERSGPCGRLQGRRAGPQRGWPAGGGEPRAWLERRRHDGVALHYADSRVPRRARHRADRQRCDAPGGILRREGGRLLPEGLCSRQGEGPAADLHLLQQRRARRPRGGAEAPHPGEMDSPRRPQQGVRLPVPLRAELQEVRRGRSRGPQGDQRRGGALRHRRNHRPGHGVHCRRHRRRESAGVRPDRRRDVQGVRRGLHPVLYHRPLRRHRRLPEQAGAAHHPDGERPHDPDRLRRPQQAAGPQRLHVAGSAGRSPGDGTQRRDAPACTERPGGRAGYPGLALVRAEGHVVAGGDADAGRPARAPHHVRALEGAIRPAPHARWRHRAQRRAPHGVLRRGQLQGVPRGLGQERRCRAREARRHPHGRDRRRDAQRGPPHPGGPGELRQPRGGRAAGRAGLVPRQRLQDGPGAEGLQPGREPARHDLRQLARLLGRHARHVRGGAQVRRADRRRPG